MAVLAGLVLVGCGYRETVTGSYTAAPPEPVTTTILAGPVSDPGLRLQTDPSWLWPEAIEAVATLPAAPRTDGGGVVVAPVRPVDEVSGVKVGSGRTDWSDLICSYAWPCQEALYVSWQESRWDAYAVNPSSGACGLFGLYPCTCIEPHCNVSVAFGKWEAGGRSFGPHWYRWWN